MPQFWQGEGVPGGQAVQVATHRRPGRSASICFWRCTRRSAATCRSSGRVRVCPAARRFRLLLIVGGTFGVDLLFEGAKQVVEHLAEFLGAAGCVELFCDGHGAVRSITHVVAFLLCVECVTVSVLMVGV